MANDFTSNITRKLARVFLEKFESLRVLSKNVNTQLLSGEFDPSSGDTIDFKRPTDYKSSRTTDGDVTADTNRSDIVTGKASGVVQDYITVRVDFKEADQAIKMDQLDQLLAPMAKRIVTDLEVDFAKFMMKNCGQHAGSMTPADYGKAVTTWSDVAEAGAVMAANGIPEDDKWIYAVNPYTQSALANVQRSLGSGGVSGELVSEAHQKAILADDFAGMRVMRATTLATYTSATTGDLVGALNGNPDVSYATAKDTMTQSLAVNGFGTFAGVIPAGAVIKISGRNRLNLSTRQAVVNASAGTVEFTATVVQDSAAFVAGAGTIVVSGPGIWENPALAGVGAYNTTDSALQSGDVVTIMGLDNTLYQPNLFWHKQAFAIGSVPIEKLYSTDTLATTEDGMQIRISKGADFLGNKQEVRFDLRPAYAALNPFFAGQSWGL